MIRRLIGPFIVFALITVSSLAIHFLQSKATESKQLKTSGMQASKGAIRLGLDGYAGYFALRSPDLRNELLRSGYRLELVDDGGDYATRVEKLANGELDMAVFTVDSYVLNGADVNYPGSIIGVISESTGSDGIVSGAANIQSLDDIKDAEQIRIAYTPDSPSQHLLKTIAVDFGMDRFLKESRSWSVSADGSANALEALNNGTADVAILWEPELSTAINKQSHTRILGTESTQGLIVDVLVVNRQILTEKPELSPTFLGHYFDLLQFFRTNRDAFIERLAADSDVNETTAHEIADGIAWKGFETNAAVWMGLNQGAQKSQFLLYDSIERTVQILIDFGDFKTSPLPQADPRSLIYADVVRQLAQSRSTENMNGAPTADALTHDFGRLSSEQWANLPMVGTLKLRPISFQSGTNRLSGSGIEAIEQMIQSLKHYPNFRVRVSGHTSARGDAAANKKLSQQRAQGVVDYLVREFAIDADRLLAVGYGGDQPLSRKPGESFRAYQNRLSRVEFNFVRDSL